MGGVKNGERDDIQFLPADRLILTMPVMQCILEELIWKRKRSLLSMMSRMQSA